MNRKLRSLVTCVSLVAFFAANTHAGTAIAACLSTNRAGGEFSLAKEHSTAEGATGEHSGRLCCHEEGDNDADVVEHDEHGPCDSSCPDSNCPDCPKSPGHSKCPCPGGCALCSVAKVPCPVAAACQVFEIPCLGASVAHAETPYTPPFCDVMLRPPRV
jgi:hypothetical protein